jgi:hypothetical protein
MKKIIFIMLVITLVAVIALPSVGYCQYRGHGGYYSGHYNHGNNYRGYGWGPGAALGGFLLGTIVGSAIAPPVYYAPPPPPRAYYYYPPPRARVYAYPY